jgi:hypothetical protein
VPPSRDQREIHRTVLTDEVHGHATACAERARLSSFCLDFFLRRERGSFCSTFLVPDDFVVVFRRVELA